MSSTSPLLNYLRMYRKRTGLSARELAFLLGCKHGSKVSRYELGVRHPGLETILAYEYLMQTSAQELFVGINEQMIQDVRERVQLLLQELDAQPFTPLVKQKFDALVDLLYPGGNQDQPHLEL